MGLSKHGNPVFPHLWALFGTTVFAGPMQWRMRFVALCEPQEGVQAGTCHGTHVVDMSQPVVTAGAGDRQSGWGRNRAVAKRVGARVGPTGSGCGGLRMGPSVLKPGRGGDEGPEATPNVLLGVQAPFYPPSSGPQSCAPPPPAFV